MAIKKIVCVLWCAFVSFTFMAQVQSDSAHNVVMKDVVVTGTRNETDIRHLPMTVSVVGRTQIEQSRQLSILPVLNTQVPGFFSTSRGVMGYGVSTGGSGQMSLRGIGGLLRLDYLPRDCLCLLTGILNIWV